MEADMKMNSISCECDDIGLVYNFFPPLILEIL